MEQDRTDGLRERPVPVAKGDKDGNPAPGPGLTSLARTTSSHRQVRLVTRKPSWQPSLGKSALPLSGPEQLRAREVLLHWGKGPPSRGRCVHS